MLCASLLVSGCETPGGSYCAAAQPPFDWRSDQEIEATPARVVRYIETGAIIWDANRCSRRSHGL